MTDDDYDEEAEMVANKGNPAARAAAATKRYQAAKTPTAKASAGKSVRKNVAAMQRKAATAQGNPDA